MCWSAEVSIVSFIIGCIVSYILFTRQHKQQYDIVVACLVLFYSFVQLAEFFMWTSISSQDVQMNITGNRIAYYSLWSNLFAIGLGFYLMTKGTIRLPLLIGSLLLIYAYINEPQFDVAHPQKQGCHLQWGFDPSFYSLVFALCVLCMLKYAPFASIKKLYAFFIGSYVLAKVTQHSSRNVSTYWCWFAACFSWLLL